MEGQKKKNKKALVWEDCTRGSNIGGEERESKGGKFEQDAERRQGENLLQISIFYWENKRRSAVRKISLSSLGF